MKDKKFGLTNIEEKYFFPIGRRTWQIISFVALILLGSAIVYYVYNVIPSSRESVHISKEELKKNQLILDEEKKEEKKECDKAEYDNAYSNLKKNLPQAEWSNLGDSVERETYEEVELYNAEYDFYYPDYQLVKYKEYELNEDAIPNILNFIYTRAEVDSLDYCEKVRILDVLKELTSHTKGTETTKFIKAKYAGYLTNMPRLTVKNIQDLFKIIQEIEMKKVVFEEPYAEKDPIQFMDRYLEIFAQDSITPERVDLVNQILSKLKGSNSITKKENKHAIARMIFSSKLNDDDAETATEDFFLNIDFLYNDKNVIEEFKKYYNLYQQKVDLAEADLNERIRDKKENREFSLTVALICFASIVSIATILLLFSIQSIIKKNSLK